MATDSILAEIREAREELAKRFNYDLRLIIEDARQRQAASGRKVVSLTPRRLTKTTDELKQQMGVVAENPPVDHLASPRLAHPEQAADFKMEVVKETRDARL